MLKISDVVGWRGSWGSRPEKLARVMSIELTPAGEKYGTEVKQIPWDIVENNCTVILDNGHWAYGYQLRRLKDEEQKRYQYHSDSTTDC